MLTVRWRRTRTVLLSSGSRWWISWADRVPDQVECDPELRSPILTIMSEHGDPSGLNDLLYLWLIDYIFHRHSPNVFMSVSVLEVGKITDHGQATSSTAQPNPPTHRVGF